MTSIMQRQYLRFVWGQEIHKASTMHLLLFIVICVEEKYTQNASDEVVAVSMMFLQEPDLEFVWVQETLYSKLFRKPKFSIFGFKTRKLNFN